MTAKTSHDVDALLNRIRSYYWWHSIDLGNGLITPGQKKPEVMRAEADLLFTGVNLEGKSLLDAGAWNGGFSVEAARRGASRVVSLDHVTWNDPHFKGRETFDLVLEVTGLQLEPVDIDLDMPGLSLKYLGYFDVVIFPGVFYHLVDPIAATRELASIAREVLILETHVENTQESRPAMIYYPGAEVNNDPSNWWGPNVACVEALLKTFGFASVVSKEGSDCARAIFHARR